MLIKDLTSRSCSRLSVPNIELLSVEEAENRGLAIPVWLKKNGKNNRQEKIVLYAPSEDCLEDIEILEGIDPEQAKRYSGKTFFSSLRWAFSEARSHELIAYIADHLKTATEIEIWTIWLDELNDDISPIKKTVDVSELTISVLHESMGQGSIKKPFLLVVKAA